MIADNARRFDDSWADRDTFAYIVGVLVMSLVERVKIETTSSEWEINSSGPWTDPWGTPHVIVSLGATNNDQYKRLMEISG